MKIKYLVLIFLCISMFSIVLSGQEHKNKEKKFVFGGMVGLTFGTVTSVEISPVAGYYITPRLLASLGLSYQYYRETLNRSTFSSNIFGIRTAMTYAVIDNIGKNLAFKTNFGLITHIEYELLNLDRDLSNKVSNERVERFWLPGLIVGTGIKQNFGTNSFFSIMILFNVLASDKTPYDNPFLRIGFYF